MSGPETSGGAERSSLTDEAYESIRAMVVDGRLQAGARVTVRPIALTLRLSATPVNAALVRLEREGVLESRLHRGYFVPELSVTDMLEIYEMREGLDCVSVRRAARSDQRGDIVAVLRESCARQDTCLTSGDIDAYRAEDLAFHQAIWSLSGNERIRRAGESLQDQMRLGNAISARQTGRGKESVREHLAIVDAMALGDEDAAERAARLHLRLTAATFTRGIADTPAVADPAGSTNGATP
jgi:DNA-binding GntR family transcriptional regulator